MPEEKVDTQIATFVEKAARTYMLIGFAIAGSTIVYAVVLGAMAVTASGATEGGAGMDDVLPLLSVILAVIALLTSVPLPFMVMKKLPQSEYARFMAAIGGAGVPVNLRGMIADNSPPALLDTAQACARFFQASLIAMSIAEAPSIYALVIALLLFFDRSVAGLTAPSLPLILAVVMAVVSLLVKTMLIPTRARLEAFLALVAAGDDVTD